ncbi:MAG TPA: histone deacetylase, partial [Nocardioidaceae bacterium]|nr:histone deacetylase [Nocardioidaceae bacterium]
VWYVSYGSNMAAARFACYLEGGALPGAAHVNPGARDATPAKRAVGVELPGTVYFAGSSPTWGGGVAFYDPDTAGRTAARAYLVTAEQFADIASQEMHRDPDVDHDLSGVLEHGRIALGPGRYETILLLGERDGLPMLTFTAPERHEHLLAPPAPAYQHVLSQGLREAFGWPDDRIAAYLDALPGADGGQPRS